MVPATTSSQSSRVNANAMPEAAISTAPTINIRRRPMRSARVVRYSETSASPINVAVSRNPASVSLSPRLTR